MGYIRSSTQQVNTSLSMDRQQAEQQETLVEVKIQTDCMGDSLRPGGSHGLIKCALAFMAGLVVALAVGFILHYFLFKPSWNQDAPALSDTSKVIMTYKLKMTNHPGRYDIFTANKTGTYLIYGWVKVPNATGQELVLEQTWEGTRTLETKQIQSEEVFLFRKVLIAEKSKVSVSFGSSYTDNFFHVYEL